MDSRRVVLISMVALVIVVMQSGPAQGANLCPYDTTGHYTYKPGESPNYEFYGDGEITYDPRTTWYFDDVYACYNAYLSTAWAPYFPKCDLNGDTVVSFDEVYSILYRVHPVGQADRVAQAACVESFEGGTYFHCKETRYNRTKTDIDTIIARHPAAQAIYESTGAGQVSNGYSHSKIQCNSSQAFAGSAFDALNECYSGATQCGTDCRNVTISFESPIDTSKLLAEYNDIADDFGGTCARIDENNAGEDAPGFHYTEYNSGPWWLWTVRATAQCTGGECACDVTYEFWTEQNSPGQAWLNEEFNNNTAACTDTRFGATPCPDADADGVCDDDDQCPGADDIVDSDADGIPDCRDECPGDQSDMCNIQYTGGCIDLADYSALPYSNDLPYDSAVDQHLSFDTQVWEPSGLVFIQEYDSMFMVDDGGVIVRLEKNSSSDYVIANSWYVGGDLEGITYNPATLKIYVVVEGSQWLKEYNYTEATDALVSSGRNWNLSPLIPYVRSGAGIEAVTFVPTPNSAQGGVFFVGDQGDGKIKIVEVDLDETDPTYDIRWFDITPAGGASTHEIAAPAGITFDLAGLLFEPESGYVHAVFDQANLWAVFDTATMRYEVTFDLPNTSVHQEGFALDNDCQIIIAEDKINSYNGRISRYDP